MMPLFSFLFLFAVVSSCSSLDVQIYKKPFDEALQKIEQGQRAEAEGLLTDLCQKEHKASCVILGEPVDWRPGLAISQGASFNDQAQFVVAHEGKDSIEAFVFDPMTKTLVSPKDQKRVEQSGHDKVLTHLFFEGLKAKEAYQLLILDHRSELLDQRDFETLALNGNQMNGAIVSCMRDDYKDTEDIWLDLENRSPQVLFMIGDNAYVDIGVQDAFLEVGPDRLWQRHMETREALRVFRWKKLVPIFGTWDDHDYGVNNGNKSYPHKEESRRIFKAFFPSDIPGSGLVQGPGVAFSFSMGPQRFIFLDNRSFRDSEKNPKGEHFGKEQTRWIMNQLSTEHVNWLINGDQFFGGYHTFESFQGNHPEAFQSFLRGVKQKRSRVLFISGDRHLSEVMDIPTGILGYPTYEITSSPVHSSVYPGPSFEIKNPLRRQAITGKWNYLFFDIRLKEPKTFQLQYESRGMVGEIYFKDKVEIKLF